MGLLEQKIVVNKDSCEKFIDYTMSNSMMDAYNQFLSQFISIMEDSRYADDAHQYLVSHDGKIYYFDSFKYIYPVDESDDNIMVLNSNVGFNKISIVELNGSSVIVQDWDFENYVVHFSSNNITDDTLKFINNGYDKKISMGNFLLQVSGHNINACKLLENRANATVKYDFDDGKFIATNGSDEVYETYNLPSNSFYSDVMDLYDYHSLLDKQCSKKKTKI